MAFSFLLPTTAKDRFASYLFSVEMYCTDILFVRTVCTYVQEYEYSTVRATCYTYACKYDIVGTVLYIYMVPEVGIAGNIFVASGKVPMLDSSSM